VKVLGDVVTTTYIYDTSLPVTQNAAPTVTPDGSSDVNSVDGPPLQAAARIIVTERHMDSNHPTEGNPRMVIERAAVDGSFVRSEGDRYTMYYPVASTGDWQWKTPVVSLSDSEYSPPEQVNNLYYDERGHLNEIQAPLNSSAGGILNRSNPWGEFSPSSPEAALYTSITLVHLDFGEWGNVIGERRGKAYTAFTYDPDFSQYVSTQSEYITAPSTDPQSGTSLDTSFKWDYRFGNKTSVLRAITTPTGTPGTSSTTDISLTTTSYDSVGRVRSVVGPASDGTAVGLADYEYGDPGAFNVPYVKTTRHQQKGETLSPTSYVFMNGLGEPVIALSNAATGDPQPWIMNSYVIRDGGGRAIGDIDPQFTSVTPGSVQTTLPTYPGPYASTASWDSFGRLSYASHNGHVRLRREYHPLEVRSFDGKRAPTMGTGAPQYASTITDGWGRVVRRAVVASESVQVDYKLNLAGQPTTITHSHGNGSDAIVRTIQYDAVGEPISSFEPNTGVKNFQWDGMGHLVGTSDARGCGVDIYHDNLYRIVAEDFSPCEANHAPYSPYVNDGSGAGAEVFYKYDAYEPGQIESSQLAALEAPQNAAGRVVSMRDRGAESRYDYDFAGRVVRSSRRVALPRATAADAVAFDGHWTDVYSVHNYAGTRVARMVVDPTTPTAYSGLTESTAINERGLPGNVTVAGGPVPGVVERWMYNADGTIPEVDLGDAATTKELRDYDELQRLTTLQVRRNAPAVWSTKTPDWTPPTAADGTNQVGPLVYLGMSYDEADNPLEITDDSRDALWPAGAKPVQDTVLGYDDRDRVISTTLAYSSGTDTFVSPNTPDGATPRPMPLQVPSGLRRAASITQSYDWNGNVKTSGDDQGLVFDRSLGTVVYDPAKPNQMTGTADGSVQVAHDPAGNVVNVEVVRAGPCEGGNCAQRFVYEWDELGQLSRAARYDFVDGDLLTSAGRYPDTTGISVLTPTVIITYEYTGSTRVRKSVSEFGAPPKHTLDLNEMWRVEEATADPNTTYTFDDSQLSTYVAGARVLKDGGPSPSGNAYHMFHELGDQLGSASLIIDHETSEVVERTSYYGHGAVDSDYRPRRWHEYRESFKFTGKEDDREVGLTFFGARYYSPYLKQWMSADPLNIDGLAGDPNPYAYVSGQTARLTDPDGLTGEEGSPPPPSNPEDDHGGCTSCGDGRTDGGGGGGGGGGGSADGAGGSGSGPQRNFPRPKIPDVVSRVATYKAAVLVGTLRELHSTASVLGATVSPIMIPVLAAQSGDKGLDKIQALAEKGLTPTMRKVAMVESKVGAAVITAVATSGAGTVIGGGRAAVTEAAAVAVEGGEGGGVTTLYRAISQAELRDLGASGTLRGGGNGLGNKFFAESAEDAAKWGREFFVHDKEPFFILRVRVSNAVASQLQRWRLLDEIGPARSAEGTVLELLNKNAVFDILGANPVVPPPTP
jgi:RHS repeat-associated protein